MKTWEIIAACERFGIPAQDHTAFARLIQWGTIARPGFGFGRRLARRRVYKACLAEMLAIITAHEKTPPALRRAGF